MKNCTFSEYRKILKLSLKIVQSLVPFKPKRIEMSNRCVDNNDEADNTLDELFQDPEFRRVFDIYSAWRAKDLPELKQQLRKQQEQILQVNKDVEQGEENR